MINWSVYAKNKTNFASFGGEKMLYDDRMKPQAIYHDGHLYVVYQANSDGKRKANPFLKRYDTKKGKWSAPIQLGNSSGVDHHLGPIIWLDKEERFHILYDCHFGKGIHMISPTPLDSTSWEEGPIISPSITYPRVWQLSDNLTVLLYRSSGHLGFWVYQLSMDGGMTWKKARTIIDFDLDPENELDEWAGSYVGAAPSVCGNYLHLGFTYWDERENANIKYTFKKDLFSRYNLYYAKLNICKGELKNCKGEILPTPLNRREAEACKVVDTGHELTNFPFVFVDKDDTPYLIAPVSQGSPWRCNFNLYKPISDGWKKVTITETDNIWSGVYVEVNNDGIFNAFLVSGSGKDESTFYGGGIIEHWVSYNLGEGWTKAGELIPDPNLIYNNPRPIVTATGKIVEGNVLFYGWEGPEGVWDVDYFRSNRGKLFLWTNGRFIGANGDSL